MEEANAYRTQSAGFGLREQRGFIKKGVHLIWRREGGIALRALEICIDSAGVVRLIKLIPDFGRDVFAEFGVQLYLELDHLELVRAKSFSRFSTSSNSHP